MLRTCSKCKKLFPLESFPLNGSKRSIYCLSCKREYDREYYQKTKERRRKRKRETDKKLRDRNRRTVLDYLQTHPCVVCGEGDPVVLDFAHREGEQKLANVSALMHAPAPTARLMAEIEKCDVRCANCHRRQTSKQFDWFYNGM